MNPRTWEQIDKHHSVIHVGIRGGAYSQRNTYTWEDGRKQVKVFGGRVINGCLEVENEALKGRTQDIAGNDLMFIAELKGTNISLYEVIRMLGKDKRARVWQMSDGEKVTAVVHIEECAVGAGEIQQRKGHVPVSAKGHGGKGRAGLCKASVKGICKEVTWTGMLHTGRDKASFRIVGDVRCEAAARNGTDCVQRDDGEGTRSELTCTNFSRISNEDAQLRVIEDVGHGVLTSKIKARRRRELQVSTSSAKRSGGKRHDDESIEHVINASPHANRNGDTQQGGNGGATAAAARTSSPHAPVAGIAAGSRTGGRRGVVPPSAEAVDVALPVTRLARTTRLRGRRGRRQRAQQQAGGGGSGAQQNARQRGLQRSSNGQRRSTRHGKTHLGKDARGATGGGTGRRGRERVAILGAGRARRGQRHRRSVVDAAASGAMPSSAQRGRRSAASAANTTCHARRSFRRGAPPAAHFHAPPRRARPRPTTRRDLDRAAANLGRGACARVSRGHARHARRRESRIISSAPSYVFARLRRLRHGAREIVRRAHARRCALCRSVCRARRGVNSCSPHAPARAPVEPGFASAPRLHISDRVASLRRPRRQQ
ncbi:hypothetical protein FGB62_216g044 [Gracilaria domingensis]|nr:hypothetical protein FGB62_216g044 [Gracilaria domingensis]